MKNVAYGFWDSSISAEMVAQNSNSQSQLKAHRGLIYYCEQRPAEKGRTTILKRDKSNLVSECLPPEFSARSRVHEYGGGDFAVGDSGIYFVNDKDQAIYQVNDKKITCITELNADVRYADLRLSPDEKYLIAVRERHENSVINDLICLNLISHELLILAQGADFYMSPAFSNDGKKIAWLQWNLPQMPWDSTELYCADFIDEHLINLQKIAGSDEESIYQPSFYANKLYYVSDKKGWWNLYCDGKNLTPINAECAYPAWIFGTNTYAFSGDRIILIVTQKALQKIAVLENNSLYYIETGYDSILPYIVAQDENIYFFGGSSITSIELQSLKLCFSHESRNLMIDSRFRGNDEEKWTPAGMGMTELKHHPQFSLPQNIEFPTTENDTAYAFYYAPCNPNFHLEKNTQAPLIVMSHGGPTSSSSSELNNKIQFWTSRGFAVIDVNYRGSTGYGRVYRKKLYGNWGKYDVEDCIKAAEYCAQHNLCDPRFIFIRGKSASGLTALLSLAHSKLFAAAAIYYGVTDLTSLLDDTHKFESRYTDLLIGPYPQTKAIFLERSAITLANQITAPVIFFQGAKDKVVLPSQAEKMIDALRKHNKGIEYCVFDNEGHGFRDAETVIETLERELDFYRKIISLGRHSCEAGNRS